MSDSCSAGKGICPDIFRKTGKNNAGSRIGIIRLPTYLVNVLNCVECFSKAVKTLVTDIEMKGHAPFGDNQPSKEQGCREQEVRLSRGRSEETAQDGTAEEQGHQRQSDNPKAEGLFDGEHGGTDIEKPQTEVCQDITCGAGVFQGIGKGQNHEADPAHEGYKPPESRVVEMYVCACQGNAEGKDRKRKKAPDISIPRIRSVL